MSANWIDAALAAVMLLSVTLATLRGFMYSAFGLAAVVVAFALALSHGGVLLNPINHALESPGISGALSHAVVFVVALVACGALGKLIRRTAHKLDLGGMDRFGGFLFGLLRGGLIAVVVVLVVGALPVENSKAWKESALTPVFGTVAFLFLGKGGMLETTLWEFDRKHRPSLNFSVILPSALQTGAEAAEAEERGLLGVNHKTNREVEEILTGEKQPCAEDDESCAE